MVNSMRDPELYNKSDGYFNSDVDVRQKFATARATFGYGGHEVFYATTRMSRMPMALSDPNLPDTPIVFCNLAFCEATGFSEAEIIGRNRRFLTGPDTDRAAIERL